MEKTKPGKKKDNTTSEMIGAGVGVAGGAAAGAAVGTAVAPGVGTAVGIVVGALAGGIAGKTVADYVDPVEEEKYWKEEYTSRPYYREGTSFNEYRPAYRYGLESAVKYPGKSFDEIESRLCRQWPQYRGDRSHLGWTRARDAVRDAHERTIKLHEERLRVDKEAVKTGEVDIRKEVVSERQKIDVPVEREEVVITRRKAHGPASRSDIRPQSEEIRIPVKHEKVRVSKEAVVTEEVDVSRRKVRDVEQVDDTVRKEELRVKEKGDTKVRRGRST
jgi:uncharacterized protein (TIGR02271 family)